MFRVESSSRDTTSTVTYVASTRLYPHLLMPSPVRRKVLNALPDLFPFVVTFTHVLLSPYTKVEESFNLHATHDVLQYGVSPSQLTHVRDSSGLSHDDQRDPLSGTTSPSPAPFPVLSSLPSLSLSSPVLSQRSPHCWGYQAESLTYRSFVCLFTVFWP